MNTLSVTMTAYSLQQQADFPFVTMPHWHVLAADTRIQAEAVAIMYTPIVRGKAQADEWLQYASKNRHYL